MLECDIIPVISYWNVLFLTIIVLLCLFWLRQLQWWRCHIGFDLLEQTFVLLWPSELVEVAIKPRIVFSRSNNNQSIATLFSLVHNNSIMINFIGMFIASRSKVMVMVRMKRNHFGKRERTLVARQAYCICASVRDRYPRCEFEIGRCAGYVWFVERLCRSSIRGRVVVCLEAFGSGSRRRLHTLNWCQNKRHRIVTTVFVLGYCECNELLRSQGGGMIRIDKRLSCRVASCRVVSGGGYNTTRCHSEEAKRGLAILARQPLSIVSKHIHRTRLF